MGKTPVDSKTANPSGFRIWDAPTRAFHWLLVLSILAAWVTAEIELPVIAVPAMFGAKATSLGGMEIHLLLGYWTTALIIFRVLWFILGSRHAQIWNMVKGPLTTWRYGLSLVGKHREAPGHNPMGALMIIVMIVLLARQVYTGLFSAVDLVECGAVQGPWAKTLTEAGQKAITSLHKQNFNLILIAIAVHVAAIIIYRIAYRSDLVGPMLTGRKGQGRVMEADAIRGTPWLRFVAAALMAGIAAWWIVTTGEHAPVVCVPSDSFM